MTANGGSGPMLGDVGDLGTLVRPDEGLIDRRVFSDEQIYQWELERIFARCWLFLCHESQLVRPGDFIATSMGEDPVLVVRQRDRTLRAFLNSCRHRGMRVCRADMGNVKGFTCTYHGWSYDTAGNLVNLPFEEKGYHNELPKDEWGLIQVAQLESYKGLVFATWDPSAPPLQDYLGDFRWYLDGFVERTPEGSEVIPGFSKSSFKGNWKFAAEQFASDGYHAPFAHASAIMALTAWLPPEAIADAQGQELDGGQASSRLGHGTGFLYTDTAGMFRAAMDPAIRAHYDANEEAMLAHLGKARYRGPACNAHANVFPTFSYLPGTNTLRVWHPRGPDRMEVTAWILVDRSMSAEAREAQRLRTIQTFSPSGMFEQDDGENWGEIQKVLRGAVQRRYPLNYQMGLGHGRENDADYPARIAGVFAEEAARGFYRRYLQLMTSETWPTEVPVPRDRPLAVTIQE